MTKPDTVDLEQRETELELACILTPEELLRAGEDMARATGDLEKAQADLDSYKAQHKDRVASLEARRNYAARLIREKQEHRKVPCDEIKDRKQGRLIVVRRDTGEKVMERPLTADEKSQLPLA
jgi:hypothetical protein